MITFCLVRLLVIIRFEYFLYVLVGYYLLQRTSYSARAASASAPHKYSGVSTVPEIGEPPFFHNPLQSGSTFLFIFLLPSFLSTFPSASLTLCHSSLPINEQQFSPSVDLIP